MKKIISPPIKPYEPIKPNKHFPEVFIPLDNQDRYSFCFADFSELKLPEGIDLYNLIFKKEFFVNEAKNSYDSYKDEYSYVEHPDSYVARFVIGYNQYGVNSNYDKELVQYEEGLLKFKSDLRKYNADLKKYEEYIKEQNIINLEQQLAELKKK